MRSDNMALYRDLTLYNFVYILLDYPTLFYDLLGEIRYDYSIDVQVSRRELWLTCGSMNLTMRCHSVTETLSVKLRY